MFYGLRRYQDYMRKRTKVSFEKAKEACMKEYNKIGDEDLRWYDVKYWLEHFSLKKSSGT